MAFSTMWIPIFLLCHGICIRMLCSAHVWRSYLTCFLCSFMSVCGRRCPSEKWSLYTHILPPGIMERLSFVYNRGDLVHAKKFRWSYKTLRLVSSKVQSRNVCKLDQVLFVDVDLRLLRRIPNCMCYIPWLFQDHLKFPNNDGVIPNVATDILPLVYPLHRFGSVPEYMAQARRPRQVH